MSKNAPCRVLYWGGMFSGKTTELMRMYTKLVISNQKVLFVYPSINTRDSNGEIQSHGGLTESAEIFTDLAQIIELIDQHQPDNVCIDEVQFIPDIENICDLLNDRGINVFMAGLNMQFDGKPWPCIKDMIHTCKVKQLFSVCRTCGSYKGWYSKLIKNKPTKNDNMVIIGGKDDYLPLCRSCFFASKD